MESDTDADLAAYGIRIEIDETESATEDEADWFAVWPENMPALDLFLACSTQWRVVVGMAGMLTLGLDYSGVEALMRMRGVPRADRAARFDELRAMERAALGEFNREGGGEERE